MLILVWERAKLDRLLATGRAPEGCLARWHPHSRIQVSDSVPLGRRGRRSRHARRPLCNRYVGARCLRTWLPRERGPHPMRNHTSVPVGDDAIAGFGPGKAATRASLMGVVNAFPPNRRWWRIGCRAWVGTARPGWGWRGEKALVRHLCVRPGWAVKTRWTGYGASWVRCNRNMEWRVRVSFISKPRRRGRGH